MRNRPTISLIFRISHSPGINLQIKVFNGGVQPNPIFPVFHRFQYQNNPRGQDFILDIKEGMHVFDFLTY